MHEEDLQSSLFTRRVLKVIGLVTLTVAAAAVFVLAKNVFFLFFLAILVAVFLHSIAGWLAGRTRLGEGAALGVVCLALLVFFVAAVWLVGYRIASQVESLSDQLPQSFETLENKVAEYPLGRRFLHEVPQARQRALEPRALTKQAGWLAGQTVGIVVSVAVVLFLGIYIASSPRSYRDGVVELFPPHTRPKVTRVLNELGHTLRRWLIGTMLSMASAAILTMVGLWLLGIPLALTLGLIAGVGEFIPNLGPLSAAIPAVLLGFLGGLNKALMVVGLYIVIQTVQSYGVTPLIQQHAVSVPVGLQITMQVLFGYLFGLLGLLVAVPVTACVLVLVKMLYLKEDEA